MSEGLKSKLSRLEAKIQPSIGDEVEQKRRADLLVLLEINEYNYRNSKMNMSHDEILQNAEEVSAYVLDRYAKWLKMSEAERKLEDERSDKELAVEIAEFRAWHLSDEGKQFDVDYARRFGSGALTDEC